MDKIRVNNTDRLNIVPGYLLFVYTFIKRKVFFPLGLYTLVVSLRRFRDRI